MNETSLQPGGRRILFLNRDLMTGIKVANTAAALGFAIERCSDSQVFSERLQDASSPWALAIIDMNLAIDWGVIGALLQAEDSLPPILGFGPHVDVEGRKAAKSAGLTRIVSNGDFHRQMPNLIERYAGTPAR
jgi:hypothetical protein